MNQNNLKKQQQVSINQTVKFSMSKVLWLLIYINEQKLKNVVFINYRCIAKKCQSTFVQFLFVDVYRQLQHL